MRPTARLFAIVQLLRERGLTRARDIAEALEVSERTVYRDIRALVTEGVPIDGQAGVGYMLRGGYVLPPLMFTDEEVDALALGARIVETWSDPALARAATGALAKIAAVLPEALARDLVGNTLVAPFSSTRAPPPADLAPLRGAVRARRKVAFRYRDGEGRASKRTVRPLSLAFFGPSWLMAAWCELRQDFRSFRPDRMAGVRVLPEGFRNEPGKTLADYRARLAQAARG